MSSSREFERDGETVAVKVEHVDGRRYRVRVGSAVHEYEADPLSDGGVRLRRVDDGGDGVVRIAHGAGDARSFMVRLDGRTHALAAPASRRGGADAGGGDGTVRAPMTGTVLDVRCAPGDRVEADHTLVVVSAMKMEHKLTAGVVGVVRSVAAAKGATVDQGEELVVVEPEEES